jgi:hypothetical protein
MAGMRYDLTAYPRHERLASKSVGEGVDPKLYAPH